MSDLLRALAGLLLSHDGLAISVFGDPERGGFCLACPDARAETVVATAASRKCSAFRCAARFGEVAGAEAEGYARLLSAAPAMLDLLATALLRWEGQVQADTEIDGGDAAEWLAGFTSEVRLVIERMVGPLAPGRMP